MNNKRCRAVLTIAALEYRRWIVQSKMVLLVVLFVFIREFAIVPLFKISNMVQSPLGIVEPFIAVVSSGLLVLILPLVYLVLMSDFPRADVDMPYIMIRSGRKQWLIGEVLFSILSAFSYVIIVFLSTIVMSLSRCFVYNGWSLAVTEYENMFPEATGSFEANLVPKGLYNQMTPYRAVLISSMLLLLYLLLLTTIKLLFTLLHQREMGLVICCIVIGLGTAGCALKANWMWWFPMAHAISWLHKTEYLRREVMPMWISWFYLVSANIFCFVTSISVVKRANLDGFSQEI